MLDPLRLQRAYLTARQELLAERGEGHWVGELSPSALSTATAVSALAVVRRAALPAARNEELGRLIAKGVEWLAGTQNADGGWGDTPKSFSNISTTMLVSAAFHLADAAAQHGDRLARAAEYVEAQGGVAGIRRRYGKDKTFSVPILTNGALAGLVDWQEVAPLPFELACLPQAIWGLARLPVVSYAIPALVAIGQARFGHRPPRNPIVRWLRGCAVRPTLAILHRMQPASGGFLEATPLTSFVVMSLAGSGQAGHPVTQRGVAFLVHSVRGDGSWPIDTNLATWTTTLAINALAAAGEAVGPLVSLDWLLSCQHRQRHPMTGATPGGWGWTDLSGAVPDVDDTSGALLALAALRRSTPSDQIERLDEAAAAGVRWLLGLQNADGGWPTFCRGWGAMPFDRSGTDLTAHALRAIHAVGEAFLPLGQAFQPDTGCADVSLESLTHRDVRLGSLTYQRRSRDAIRRGLRYLERQQRADGSFVPLWFGNQFHPAEANPVYGTARVLLAYRDLGLIASEPARRALRWLTEHAGADGGWGGPAATPSRPPQTSEVLETSEVLAGGVSSVEETAVAVEALLAAEAGPGPQSVVARGADWLIRAVESKRHREPAPIGLYFARLWYYEKLYPLVFLVSALGQAMRCWPPAAGQHADTPALESRD
jgi:squalene-hopene/tetraprenyl-beta-curcumene cyclase